MYSRAKGDLKRGTRDVKLAYTTKLSDHLSDNRYGPAGVAWLLWDRHREHRLMTSREAKPLLQYHQPSIPSSLTSWLASWLNWTPPLTMCAWIKKFSTDRPQSVKICHRRS